MYSEYRRHELELKSSKLGIVFDVMVTGATGAGKSMTLNTVFQKKVAEVGSGVNPQTMDLNSYRLNNAFRLWDTPGLGDGKSNDKNHAKLIIDLLYKSYGENNGFIDLVLVIVDGSNRDMGTIYKLLNDVIVPNFPKERILVAINQADMAMKGRHWNPFSKQPDDTLRAFLEDKARSLLDRVHEATGIKLIKPVYYSAEHDFHTDKLLDLLIDNMPTEKRRLRL
ncbi:GTPase family protein [Pseudomonas sp. BEA3.1]|uniref:GTPase family protein n=1 Tax=Pseudomonas sp. BEA3.1 TaxID=3083251 RepID=UPI0029654965|nr:GTPase [Pseudomonas sp. BEA3.1]MDW2775418.1 GTPase [Pseudomonas sp. BEA3.1]